MGAESTIYVQDASNDIYETIILSASIKSIKTEKTKSSPTGQFELELAPTYNWVARLTIGSWLAIFMTQTITFPSEFWQAGFHPTHNSSEMLKMVGRIDSVRVEISVDPNTGARNTSYFVSGRDWGCAFENTVYIDGLAFDHDQQQPGLADALKFLQVITDPSGDKDKGGVFPTTTELVGRIKNFYGALQQDYNDEGKSLLGANLFPSQIMKIPAKALMFLHPKTGASSKLPSTSVAELTTIVPGVLTSYDTYEDVEESCSMPNMSAFMGENTFWQLLLMHSNPVLNELITDIRWEDEDSPTFALYKRLRPFVTADNNIDEAYAAVQTVPSPPPSNLRSKFEFIKQTEIEAGDIISVNAGGNWRDSINFIEILLEQCETIKIAEVQNNTIKRASQIMNADAIARDGLKPMILRTKFLPGKTGDGDSEFPGLDIQAWAPLLYEWYSHQHLMLNGNISFIGQDKYIAVGENIAVDIGIFGGVGNMSSDLKDARSVSKKYNLLAHVESVQHTFTVDGTGARIFITTVQFVRGVLQEASSSMFGIGGEHGSGKLMLPNGDDIDSYMTSATRGAFKGNYQKIATSTPSDPDPSKMKGT